MNQFDERAAAECAEFEALRCEIEVLAAKVNERRRKPVGFLHNEAGANFALAFRHLEDAAMRLAMARRATERP
jgi:hypothetical protein